MKTKKANRYGIITIFFASVFMIIQRVLITATVVPEYAQNPTRFYIYNILLALTAVGGNLLALYMGYYANENVKKNFISPLGRMYLMYVLLALIINIFCLSVNIRDYWIILFPISQNLFGFAVSFLFVFASSPLIVTHLNKFQNSNIKKCFTLLSIFFVVLPTMFGKDIFSFSGGNNILWVAYLFLMGYVIRRFNIVSRFRYRFMHFILSGFFLSLLVILMTKVSMHVHLDVSTANRFSVPWSIFSVYYSVLLFICIERYNARIGSFKSSFKTISIFLVATQVATNWQVLINKISEKYKIAFPDSAFEWSKRILLIIGIYFSVCIVLALVICLVQKFAIYKWIERKLVFNSWFQLIDKLLKIKDWIYANSRLILSAVFYYFFTALQIFLLSDYRTKDRAISAVLTIFTQRQAQLFLNVIIITAFLLLIFLITKRFWYAFTFTLIIDLLLTVSTVIKVKLRMEPILPSDLLFLSNISEILSMISPIIVIVLVFILMILAISTFILQHRANKFYNLKISVKKRLLWIFMLLFLFSGLFWVNHQDSPSNLLFRFFKVDSQFYNQRKGAMINGPLIQFINNIDVKIMDRPKEYSEEKIKSIMKKYDKEATQMNESRKEWAQDQTVVFVLSESFSDPSRLPNIKLSRDPIPFVNSLSSKTTSGLMLSSAYGGGTANMEWQSLTGMDMSNLDATLPTPYTQLVNKQKVAPSFLNLFDESSAIHPYWGTLYNRMNVFKKFGFDTFRYLESPDGFKHLETIGNNPYVSDEASYNETLDKIKKNENRTQFIQLSTMQNHMPYDNYYEENDFDYDGDIVTDSTGNTMRTYLKGLNLSDQALEKFILEIDNIQKPITLLWYGDHLPGIYKEDEFTKYPYNYRETNFFVYNNKYMDNNQKNEKYSLVSPYVFPSLALEQAQLKVTPFYALLTEVLNNIPATTNDPNSSSQNVYNGQRKFVDQNNNVLKESQLSEEQKEIIKEYMLIQYDLIAGKQYSAKWAMKRASE
ncbi:LTA synthase family protein [Enterococcus sp. AZ007]|uniref:LTA synthase family protein n=1 Tax=Enterococcus sp. AZ007 TaxID=2774839 RepID=UPI003F267F8F